VCVAPDNVIGAMKESVHKYADWALRDETDNFAQRHDIEVVKQQLLPDLRVKITKRVDEEMLAVLENLKKQLGIGGKKKKKGKKGKKGKGKKGKGKK